MDRLVQPYIDAIRREALALRADGKTPDAIELHIRTRCEMLGVPDPYIDDCLDLPQPRPPFTREGIEQALRAAGRKLRGNRRAYWYLETQVRGLWVPCIDTVRDVLMEDLADACRDMDGDPWRIARTKLEDRLLRGYAALHEIAGPRDGYRERVHVWAAGRRGRFTYKQIAKECDILQKYEAGGRLPAVIETAIRRELEEAGWTWRIGRLASDRAPCMCWHDPTIPRREVVVDGERVA